MKTLLCTLRQKTNNAVLSSDGKYKGWHIANLVFLPHHRDHLISSSNHQHDTILKIYQDWMFKWRFRLFTETTQKQKNLFNFVCEQHMFRLAHNHLHKITTKMPAGGGQQYEGHKLCKMVWNTEQRSYLEKLLMLNNENIAMDSELHYDIELGLILHRICCTCRRNMRLLTNKIKR